MRRLKTLLEDYGRRLVVPEPERGRLLEELAADMEDMYGTLRAAGVARGEAERRTVERLLPGVAASAELEHVHRPLYVRLAGRLGGGGGTAVERAGLVLLATLVLGGVLAGLPLQALLRDPSPFLLPVLLLGCGTLLVLAWATHRLVLARTASAADAGRGLGLAGALLVATSFLAVFALVADFYAASAAIVDDPSLATPVMIRLLRSDGVVLLAALQLSLVAALWRMVLGVRVAAIRAADSALARRGRLTVLDGGAGRDVA